MMQLPRAALLVLALSVTLLAASCTTTVSTTNLSGQAAPPTRVTLAAGDTIKLVFPGATELSQDQKIRADGKISLPMVGEVDAAGKTVTGIQAELVSRYKDQLKNNEVVVSLVSAPGQVVISGAVAHPAKIAFEKPTTVFQAIMEAGGPSTFGNLKAVRLIRTFSGIQHSQVFDLSPILRGTPTRPFYVRDGDLIYVPQSVF